MHDVNASCTLTADGDCNHSQAEFPLPWMYVLGQYALGFRYIGFLVLDQEGLA